MEQRFDSGWQFSKQAPGSSREHAADFAFHAVDIPHDWLIWQHEDLYEDSDGWYRNQLPACPVETTLTLIGDKWKVLILHDLMPGTKRFGELKKSIGSVSQKVLTAQLRDMEEKGLVNRKVYAEVPPRVEYSLTDLGRSLKPILDAMWDWGEGYKAQNS